MFQHLAQDAAVAAADHEDAPGVPGGEQRNVRHHLMGGELVALGGLGDAVERHDPAEGRVRVDHEILEVGAAPVQDLTDLVGHGDMLVQVLAGPLRAQSTRPRLCSMTLMLSGPNAARSTGMPSYGLQSPHMNTSSAAKLRSGHVWLLMCDSASTTTPEMPRSEERRVGNEWVST